jgi:hypothetical protein
MNQPERSPLAVAINALALTGVLLVMAGLIWIMYHYTRPEPVDEAHIAERRKNLAELNAQSKDALENYAWIDQTKGLVQLPVARAMELAAKEWQNPVAARSNLLWRLGKATTPSPRPPQTNAASAGANK